METLSAFSEDLRAVLRFHGAWMTWNLLLALVPLALAPLLFRRRGRRTGAWWAGVALFGLFLPNAPYVLTDLVHLRTSVLRAGDDVAVLTAVLPVYAAFIGIGLVAYALSLAELGRYLDREGLSHRRPAVEVGVHALCAVGVVLGRFARLNSWEPVTEPHGTLERIVLTLSARWAAPMVVVTFVLVWVTYAATRALLTSAGAALRRTRTLRAT